MRRTIKVFYVAVIAFVITAAGLMLINRLDQDIGYLDQEARETRLKKVAVAAKQSDMQKELSMKDTAAYIKETARSLYGYLMPGEILFVVENPEALYPEGEAPQLPEAEEDPAG